MSKHDVWIVKVQGPGHGLSGSGNKLSGTSAIVMIRVEAPSAQRAVDTEVPTAPNMSPCFPEHGDNNVVSACLLQGLRVQRDATSA